MGFIGNIVNGIAKAIPVLVQKIVTTLLVFFFLGMLFGYFIVPLKGVIAIALFALVLVVLFYKLDEGFLLLLLYFIWVFWF